jgi:hypothetical protein
MLMAMDAGADVTSTDGGDRGKEEVPALPEPESAPLPPTAATATKRPNIQEELMRMSAYFLKRSQKGWFRRASVDSNEYFFSN